MEVKYTEENKHYTIDCTAAVWSTNAIHDYYQNAEHKYGELNFLKDADYVIESDTTIFVVEYKNSDIPKASKPEKFKPENGNLLDSVAKKYFDTLHCLQILGKNKSKKYIYILEYPNGNVSSRLMVRNKLQNRLPFKLQKKLGTGEVKLIDEVKVVSIAEWNADPELGMYPISVIQNKNHDCSEQNQ